MKLIGNRILAELIISEGKTEAGVILPEKLDLEKNRAEIMIVGPKVKHYRVGQVVQYNSNTAHFATLRGSECVFLREDEDVIGVFSEKRKAQN
jgi:co-chaperonin GroES (HSP10)